MLFSLKERINKILKKYDLECINEVLSRHQFDLTVRAEKLSVDIFIEIANELSK